jgi:hypothetical protein
LRRRFRNGGQKKAQSRNVILTELERSREIQHLTRQVINGKPLIDIPLVLFPDLRNVLNTAKTRAISLGQLSCLKAIQRIIIELNHLEPHSRLLKTQKCPDGKLNSLILELLVHQTKGTEVTIELLLDIIYRLKTTIASFLGVRSFERAQKAQDLRELLKSVLSGLCQSDLKANFSNRILKCLESSSGRQTAASQTKKNISAPDMDTIETELTHFVRNLPRSRKSTFV